MAKREAVQEVEAPQTIDPRIKAAIVRNCGGWSDATPGELLAKWASLDEDTKARYLAGKDG